MSGRKRRAREALSFTVLLNLAIVVSCYRAQLEVEILTGSAGIAGQFGGGGNAGEATGGLAQNENGGAFGVGSSLGAGSLPGAGAADSGGGGRSGESSEGGRGGEGGEGGELTAAPPCAAASLPAVQLACRWHMPSVLSCATQDPNSFLGCSASGCSVCDDVTDEYPYYFKWHPCCSPNTRCASSLRVRCNTLCPPPTEHDKIAPCVVPVPDR